MEHKMPCDTKTSNTSQDNSVDQSDGPTTISPSQGNKGGEEEAAQDRHLNNITSPDAVTNEPDMNSEWRPRQEVEEVNVPSLPSMKDSSNQEVKSLSSMDDLSKQEVKSLSSMDDSSKQEVKSLSSMDDLSKQEVKSLSSMDDSLSQESTVRRRKRKTEDDTLELRNSTQKIIDTYEETHYTQEPEDDSPEAIKKREKIKKIREVLSSEPLDLKTLKELAISSGGLVDDGLRKEAWPLLMGLGLGNPEMKKPEMEVVEGHRDFQQVVLDVKRTLKRFPPGIEDARRVVLMDQLIVLIIRVLMRHPDLYYYQGYHDVAITFLLVTGEDMGFQLVEKLSITHLRDFMLPTMEKTNYYLTYLYPILENANQSLHECLDKSGVGTVFCLPWLITWFAHTLSDYRHVVRLYDFFLASPELMPMYIATAIVLQKEKELLAEKEREVASIFAILSKDTDNLPFEAILVKARELYEKYPPDTLTESVDKIIAKREEDEKREKQRIEEMRKKGALYRRKNTGWMGKILPYLPTPLVVPAQRQKLIKLALFTVSIIVARSLYKQYYTSAIGYPTVPE